MNIIKFPPDTMVGAVVRGDEVFVPREEVTLDSEDHVILFVTNKRSIRDIEKLFQVSAGFF